MLAAKYCGLCGSSLRDIPCTDVTATAMECDCRHRYYRFPEQYTSDITGVDWTELDPPQADMSDEQFIDERLRNPIFRSRLNNQLALVLLGIQSRYRESRRVAVDAPDKYCLLCGDPLNQYDADWVRSLRCEAGHQVALRGEHVWLHDGQTRIELCIEPSDKMLRTFVAGWIEPHKRMEGFVPPSVYGILKRFLEKRGNP